MIPICIVSLLSFVFCLFAFSAIEHRKQKEEITENVVTANKVTVSNKTNIIKKALKFYSDFNTKQWIVLIAAIILQGFLAYRATSILTSYIDLARILSLSVILVAASIVDLYTKKIPNIYPALLLVGRAVLLIGEFIFRPSTALRSLILSVVGLVISFLILMLLKIIAKGGFGMGDVKLLSASCAFAGMITVLYMFTLAMFVCMLTSVFLMATKKMNSKDEIPFGPFIYIGLFITVMIGALG